MKIRTIWNWKRVVMLFVVVGVSSLPLMGACKWFGIEGEWRTLIAAVYGFVAAHAFMAKWELWRFEVTA